MFKKYITMTISRILYNGQKLKFARECGCQRVEACGLLHMVERRLSGIGWDVVIYLNGYGASHMW